MAGTNANRFSTYTSASGSAGSEDKNGEPKKAMWNSMLESVASGKRLPEKNLLVMGGSVESQRDFIESLSNNELRRNFDRQTKAPPVANQFALGYTYYDLLDADHEDTLARISAYLLTSPSPSFAPLIKPLLTPQSIPNTLLVVLLDWSEPWSWVRQLREWMLLLRTVLLALPDENKTIMEEVMSQWKERGRGGSFNLDGTIATAANEGDVSLPPGPGEWEEPLGLPLCVVCQNAEKMDVLEKTQSWKEEDFDVVLQFMRTILLRHGASLIYTAPSASSQLQTLAHSSLGIHSLLKKQPLKPNVIDRDKVVVPPNWDSWSKIRVLREGFDVEVISEGWSIDLVTKFPPPGRDPENAANAAANGVEYDADGYEITPGSAVTKYEESIRNPTHDALHMAGRDTHATTLEVETQDTQLFLEARSKQLEAHKQKMEEEDRERAGVKAQLKDKKARDDEEEKTANVSDHIGPVQFNVGGIQVDADDMMKRLQDRQTYASSPEPESPVEETPDQQQPIDTENLQNFFANLMNRKGPGAKNGV
ncbi:dynein light intermediate chain-domain-containing protein [Coniella lustricola]|uniref:Dynein light intermediate chain-domain-containing protein n=1 Tax=Coniella lustricola TaxID=2025994 RepID=A0A2T3A9N7_9PEZI|nr:dynein light intermediate chain-domain-containing protein [Coniella lustricola]